MTNFHINDLTLFSLKKKKWACLLCVFVFEIFAILEMYLGGTLWRHAGMCYRFRIIINFFVVVSGSVPATARGPSSQEDHLFWGGQYSALCNMSCERWWIVSTRLILDGFLVSWELISINVCHSVTKFNILIHILKTDVILKILTNLESNVSRFDHCRGRASILYKPSPTPQTCIWVVFLVPVMLIPLSYVLLWNASNRE